MVKKILCTVALSVMMLGTLVGCGKDEKKEKADPTTEATTTEAQAVEIEKTAKEVADALFAGGEFKDALAPIDMSVGVNRLYMLDEAQIEDAAFYTNSSATAEEIAVVKVKDQAYVETVKAAYETRIADQKVAFESYVPEEIPKLEDAVVYENGNVVILCVSCDSSKINTVIGDIFK